MALPAERTSDPEKPVKDYGSISHWSAPMTDDAMQVNMRERWEEQQAMYIGLRYPEDCKKRKRRKHSRQKTIDNVNSPDSPKAATLPSQRVASILGRDEDEEDEFHQTHDIFCELEELRPVGDEGELEWKETARWIKFEEDVEEGGERWSKPHVATLSLHSLFELRKGMTSGTVILDMDANSILQITDIVLDSMVASGQLEFDLRDRVQEVLLMKHRHQFQKREGKGLPMIRSLADIGRKMSARNLESKDSGTTLSAGGEKQLGDSLPENTSRPNQLTPSALSRSGSSKDISGDLARDASSLDMSDPSAHKFNQHFLKKIPQGAEASNILVGEVDFLNVPVVAFVRLQKAIILGDITEVPVPSRFIFILLGPPDNHQKYHEIGRSIATLMSDEVFHDVAYKARDRYDLLAAIDEFLDCVTVLPPGEWDPTIRIEPPKSVPSQEKRKKPTEGQKPEMPNGMAVVEVVEEEHGDATLVRTGRIFGGLIADVKRKAPWYLSDFTDALHVQCIAAFFFMYFASLTPIITFGGLLGAATGNYIAAMESLVSGAICGVTYHLFSGQPLTIVGSTGPVLVFETIVYKFCQDNDWTYLEFRFWIGAWMCSFLLIMVAFDLSALVRYITRFTEESFAMLIAIIFIYEAFKKQIEGMKKYPINFHPDEPIDSNCTCYPPIRVVTNDTSIITATTAMSTLEEFSTVMVNESTTVVDWSSLSKKDCQQRSGVLFGSGCDTPDYVPNVFLFSCLIFIGTFSLSMSLKMFRNTRFFPNRVRVLISDFAVFTSICLMVGVDALVGLKTAKLEVPVNLQPTRPGRSWVVYPFHSGKTPWLAIPAGIPPALFATILIFMDQQITAVIINRKEHKLRIGICTCIGTPWFVAATVLSINHVRSLTKESESAAPGERPKFLGVREQRATGTLVFIMVGVSAFMAKILKLIPMSVLYGVFLYMGISSLKGIQFVQRVLVMLMPAKYQPDYMFLRNVPIRRVHLFTFIQMCCLSGLCIIKEIESISIIFPLMVLAMCFIRKSLDYVFSRHELKWLDDIMPESHKREKAEKKKMMENEKDDEALEEGNEVHPEVKISISMASNIPEPGSQRMNQVNISEEMSKTLIWRNLSGGDMSDDQTRSRKGASEKVPATTVSKDPPVKFCIADDDDDEKDCLVKPPQVFIESPTSTKSGDQPTKV